MRLEAIIFLLAFTLHNIEEALWLPQWMQKNMPDSQSFLQMFKEALGLPLHPQKERVSSDKVSMRDSFLFADLCITVLGYMAVGFYVLFPDNLNAEFIYIGLVGAMLVNTIMPHLLLTIRYRKYCPGVLTGCLLFLPLNTIILMHAANEHLQISEIVMSTLVIGIILLTILPLSKRLADVWLKSLL